MDPNSTWRSSSAQLSETSAIQGCRDRCVSNSIWHIMSLEEREEEIDIAEEKLF